MEIQINKMKRKILFDGISEYNGASSMIKVFIHNENFYLETDKHLFFININYNAGCHTCFYKDPEECEEKCFSCNKIRNIIKDYFIDNDKFFINNFNLQLEE